MNAHKHGQGLIVVTRRTTAKTVFTTDGNYYETVNNAVTVKSQDFDCLVGWDSIYDAVVIAMKTEAFKNL